MEKILRPKDRILLGLAFLGDFLEYVGSKVYMSRKALWHSFPVKYKYQNYYNTLYRSLDTGEIKKVIENGNVCYQLTSLGKKKLIRRFPLLNLQNKKWDGYWRVVIFDISEKKANIRKALRTKLLDLGFGMWQKSVYITPFNVAEDIRDFLVANGLEKEVCVLVAEELYAGDVKELVKQIWKLDKINKEYEVLVNSWYWVEDRNSKKELEKQAKKCYSQYLQLIAKDPHLPKDLLPDEWFGEKAINLVKKWLKYLK